ncbi:hypothetical protein FSP39_020306 [Pinctada imbricata]|uniref:B box-type domain-containing protein n=1 Tax=Pinctada imbricata TaxID=66713 RepID=A0AA89C0M5_PINIB|nr:hypothetical protein FSP39_020306 [Pinctada imbricata]
MASALDEEPNNQLVLAKTKLELLCDVCIEEPLVAVYHCVECDQNYCENCESIHGAMKMTKDHKIVMIEDGVVTDKPKDHICGKNKSYLYCGICNRIICSKCVRRLHRRHGIHVPQPSSPHPAISGNLRTMLQSKLEYYEQQMRKVEPETNIKVQLLRQKANELKAEVDVIHKEAMDEIKEIERENVQKLEDYKEKLVQKKNRYDERLVELRDNVELLNDDSIEEFKVKAQEEVEILLNPEEPRPVTRTFSSSKYEEKFLALKDRLTKSFDDFAAQIGISSSDKKKKKKSKA